MNYQEYLKLKEQQEQTAAMSGVSASVSKPAEGNPFIQALKGFNDKAFAPAPPLSPETRSRVGEGFANAWETGTAYEGPALSNLDPEFMAKHPTFAAGAKKLEAAKEIIGQTAPGKFLSELSDRTGKFATAGQIEEFKPIDLLAFPAAFAVPGGVQAQAGRLGTMASQAVKIPGKVAPAAARGAAMGGALGLGEAAANKEGLADTAKTVAGEAALWAGFELGGVAIGAGGKALWAKIPNSTKDALLKRFSKAKVAEVVEEAASRGPDWMVDEYGNVMRPGQVGALQLPMTEEEAIFRAAKEAYNQPKLPASRIAGALPEPKVVERPIKPQANMPSGPIIEAEGQVPFFADRFGNVTPGDRFGQKMLPKQEPQLLLPPKREIPLGERTYDIVGDRSVNAYMYDHPEVKPYVQSEAKRLLQELIDSVKGQRFVGQDEAGQQVITGTTKYVSEPIARIQEATGGSYKDIASGLVRIIKDEGAENRALAKRIELIIDDNLSKGVKSFDGYDIPPMQEYLNAKGKVESLYGKSEYPISQQAIAKNSPKEYKVSSEEIGLFKEGGEIPYAKEIKGAAETGQKGYSDVPASKRSGMGSAEKLAEPAAIKGSGPEGRSLQALSAGELNKLAQEGKLSLADYRKTVEPSTKIYEIDKQVIQDNLVEAQKKGLHLSENHVTFEQWYYRKYGKEFKGKDEYFNQNFYAITKSIEKDGLTREQAITKHMALEKRKYQYFKNKASSKVIETLDKAEASARDRIASRKGRLMSGPPVDDIADYAIIGAAKVAKGTVKFSQWSSEMVKEFGEEIRPYLQQVYGKARSLYGRYKNGDYEAVKLIEGAGGKESPASTISEAKKTASTETLGFAGPRQMGKTAASAASPGETSPVQRKAIVNYLKDKLDIPIRVGRYQQRTALGIYKVKPEVIRTRLAEDIETIAHEVGHHLDKQLGLVSRGFDSEMKALAAGVKGDSRTEGVAQFMNFYLTDAAKAKAKAPNYFKEFEKKLEQHPEIAEVLETAQAQIKTWLEQPSKARVLGSLSVNQGTPKRPMTADRLYQMAVDEIRPMEKAVKEITKGSKLDANKDPFVAAWLARGWRGKAETALRYGQMDDELKKIGPSLDELLKPVDKHLDDFRAFITSKRSLELSARDIETGIDPVDAKRALQEIEQELGTDAVKQFDKTFKELVGFQDYIMQRLVKSGVLDKEAAKAIRQMNQDYVPFYRLFDENLGTLKFQGKTYANLSTPIKRLKGSGRTIIDPLESVIKNTYAFTNLAERNDVGRLFVEMAEKFEGSGKWIEKVAAPMHGTKFQLEEVKRVLADAGADLASIDLDKMATIFRPSSFPAGKENIVTVYRNGKPEFYQLDPELYRAMLFLDKESSNVLTQLLSYPAAALRAGATLTPEFVARNPVRDQFAAFVNSKYGFIPGVDLLKGLSHVLRKDDLYWKWYQSGGAHSAFVSVDRDYLQKNLRQILQKDLKSKAKYTVTHPLDVLRALSEMTEEATRVQEFAKGLKKEGVAGAKSAALASRDITIDFGRAGTIGKEANRWVAFLNSGIQGMDKMVRQWKANPVKSTFRAVTSITLPSVALYFVNRDNKHYQEIPQWEKDIYWLIPYNDGKNFVRIPKPFELGILFGTIPERFLEWADKDDPEAFKDLGKTIKQYVFLDMLPDKEFGYLPPGMIPTALLPVIEVYANRSTFTGSPIVPRREERLLPEMQYGPYTSEVAKIVGKATNNSPRKIEQMMFGYTAGLGRNIVSGMDWALDATGVVDRVPKPTGKVSEIPLVRGFVSKNPTAGQSATIDRFYDLYNETEQLYNTLKLKVEAGETVEKPTDKQIQQLQALKSMRKIAGQLSEMRKAASQVQGAKNISPKDKRKALDALDMAQINLIRGAFGMEPLEEPGA